MIKLEYKLTNYEDLLRFFSRVLKIKIVDNAISLTPEIGSGTIKQITLPNELQLMIYDCIPAQDIVFYREKSTKEYFVLRVNDIVDSKAETGKSSMFLGKTTHKWFYMASANVRVRNIHAIISKEWLDRYLSNDEAGETLKNYIGLKTSLHQYEHFDMEYRQLVNEIIQGVHDENFGPFIVQNRIMLIIERLFTRLYKQICEMPLNTRITSEELARLRFAERELMKDFSSTPPSIPQLAKTAAMSASRLKILFKELYGLPVYQYFQKHRMIKAKAMLVSRKYSVRQVALELGYSNVSNFAKAFKNFFDQLPANI